MSSSSSGSAAATILTGGLPDFASVAFNAIRLSWNALDLRTWTSRPDRSSGVATGGWFAPVTTSSRTPGEEGRREVDALLPLGGNREAGGGDVAASLGQRLEDAVATDRDENQLYPDRLRSQALVQEILEQPPAIVGGAVLLPFVDEVVGLVEGDEDPDVTPPDHAVEVTRPRPQRSRDRRIGGTLRRWRRIRRRRGRRGSRCWRRLGGLARGL